MQAVIRMLDAQEPISAEIGGRARRDANTVCRTIVVHRLIGSMA